LRLEKDSLSSCYLAYLCVGWIYFSLFRCIFICYLTLKMEVNLIMKNKISTEKIAQALYSINRHAKAAPKPQHLYTIKKKADEKRGMEKKATNIGLHLSVNAKDMDHHSTVLIKVADYLFHISAEKEDFQTVQHLGHLDEHFRNPQSGMSLS